MVKKLELALTEWEAGVAGPTMDYTVFKSHLGYVLVPAKEHKPSITMMESDALALATMVIETHKEQS